MTEEDVEDLIIALLESAGKDENEAMTFDELLQLLEKHPGLMDNLTLRWKADTATRVPCF